MYDPELSDVLASKKARENNSPFFETAFRRRPIGSYMSLPYFQPYGPPVTAMFFFDEFSG